jgi:hypothetical protein
VRHNDCNESLARTEMERSCMFLVPPCFQSCNARARPVDCVKSRSAAAAPGSWHSCSRRNGRSVGAQRS